MIYWAIIALVLVVAAVWMFYKVPAVNQFFRDSETVALQAVKAAAGAIGTILALVDQDQLQSATQTVVTNIGLARWWPVLLLIFGLAMIAVRQARQ